MKSDDSKGTRPSAFPEGELPYGGGQEGTVALHASGEVAGGAPREGQRPAPEMTGRDGCGEIM